jgi:Xaa-Pro aminopeptidase
MSKKETPNRSRFPQSKKFMKFIASQWEDLPASTSKRWEVADYAQTRRERLARLYPGKLIMLEAGSTKVRSNDTEYRFRADTAFTYFTGWGSETVPDSVLIIDARKKTPKARLYLRPTAGRDTNEFFANSMIGEFWTGPRPTLEDIETQLGIPTYDLTKLEGHLKDWPRPLSLKNAKFAEKVSAMRFVKDDYEIRQMREAIEVTARGFADIAKVMPRAIRSSHGERVIETTFFARAREEGYDLGYETIAASGAHACILHWNKNTGSVNKNDLVLVDAGCELNSLYTADVTRTIPASGKFSKEQRWVYEAVLEAADAAFAIVKPGIKFREIHNAAIAVIAKKVAELGLIPVSAEDALREENQHHRRYMVHGTSHHLGLDVHDCAKARREHYQDGVLQPGMIFTIEPGLYFHADDLTVPKAYRGIGVRIEDNVLVTEDGCENLSGLLPREVEEVESWFAANQLGVAG